MPAAADHRAVSSHGNCRNHFLLFGSWFRKVGGFTWSVVHFRVFILLLSKWWAILVGDERVSGRLVLPVSCGASLNVSVELGSRQWGRTSL